MEGWVSLQNSKSGLARLQVRPQIPQVGTLGFYYHLAPALDLSWRPVG